MKNLSRLALISASLAVASYAAPFLAVGDGAELFLTGTLGVRADDNIFADQTDQNDAVFEITPGVDLTFGKGAQMQGSLSTGVAFLNYSDNSSLDTALFNSSFVSRFDDGNLKLNFNLGYNELNQNTPDIRGLTRRDVFAAGGNAEVEIVPKVSAGGGITFIHENFKRGNYSDSDSITAPLNLYYELTPKMDLSLGYRIREYELDLGANSTDHFFSVGARGEFAPKFTGTFAIGINTRDLSPGGSETLLGLDASLAYEITPTMSLQFGASNDFGTTPQGEQQKNLSVNAAIMTKLTEEWSVNGGLRYRAADYDTRTDDYWEASLGADYVVNANVRVVAAYIYRNYVSDLVTREFTNSVFSVAANFRY